MTEKGRFLPIANLTHDRLLLGEKWPEGRKNLIGAGSHTRHRMKNSL